MTSGGGGGAFGGGGRSHGLPMRSGHAERPTVRLATYNIHKFAGIDGRRDPARTFAVIRELDADVVALQEFDSRTSRRGAAVTVADLEAETGYAALVHATRSSRRGGYRGNIILTRFPTGEVERHDIGELEPRGLMVADLDVHGTKVRVAVTHLALWPAARLRQAARLASELSPPKDGMLVLAGDLNEWRRAGRSRAVLARCYGAHPMLPTFPALRPFVALDQVWVRPRSALAAMEVHRSRLAREASDHLPVKATLKLPDAIDLVATKFDGDDWGAVPA